MPGRLGNLRRLSQWLEAMAKSEQRAVGPYSGVQTDMHWGSSDDYKKLLNGWDPKMPEEHALFMYEWPVHGKAKVVDNQHVATGDNDLINLLTDRYGIAPESNLYRGGELRDLLELSKNAPMSTSLDPEIAFDFMMRNMTPGRIDALGDDYDEVVNGLQSHILPSEHKYLPMPSAGEDEFISPPGASYDLVRPATKTKKNVLIRTKSHGGAV